MSAKEERNFWAASFEFLQRTVREAGPAAGAAYTLVGAVILLGAVGYLLDRWLHTAPWLLLAGLLLGVVVGFYELAKVVWRK